MSIIIELELRKERMGGMVMSDNDLEVEDMQDKKCLGCGKAVVVIGDLIPIFCDECSDSGRFHNDAYRKICFECRKPLEEQEDIFSDSSTPEMLQAYCSSLCPECFEKLKVKGICTSCRKKPALYGQVDCGPCHEMISEGIDRAMIFFKNEVSNLPLMKGMKAPVRRKEK